MLDECIDNRFPRVSVISAFQELKATIENREPAIEKIRLGYTRLSPDGASVAAREVEPLVQRWKSLVAVLTEHLESRAGLLVKFRGYHEEHSQVDRGVEELLGDIQQIESDDDVPLRDRIIQLEVGAFVFLFFFVLRRCSTVWFALRRPMALRFFRSWMSWCHGLSLQADRVCNLVSEQSEDG